MSNNKKDALYSHKDTTRKYIDEKMQKSKIAFLQTVKPQKNIDTKQVKTRNLTFQLRILNLYAASETIKEKYENSEKRCQTRGSDS